LASSSSPEQVPHEAPAEEAAAVMTRLRRLAADMERRADDLQRSLEERVVIEQAKGMLSERLGLSPEECGLVLEHAAQIQGLPVHRLAADIASGAPFRDPGRRLA
jgi:AmiR/NasT family two-component response regulator